MRPTEPERLNSAAGCFPVAAFRSLLPAGVLSLGLFALPGSGVVGSPILLVPSYI